MIAEDANTELTVVRMHRKDLSTATSQTNLPQVGALDVVLGSPLGFANAVTLGRPRFRLRRVDWRSSLP